MVVAALCNGDISGSERKIGQNWEKGECNQTTLEQLWDTSVPQWLSPDLNSIEHLWTDLKMTIHRWFAYNLMELQRIYQWERDKLPRSRCSKLVGSLPKMTQMAKVKLLWQQSIDITVWRLLIDFIEYLLHWMLLTSWVFHKS